MGFADNVFDQKRGGRRESGLNGPMTVANLAGKKRTIEPNGQAGPSSLRKLDLPTPEPDFANRVYMSRENSEYPGLPIFTANTLPPMLPSVKSVTDVDGMASSASDERSHHITPSTPVFGANHNPNTLAPLLSTGYYGSPYMDHRIPPGYDQNTPTSATKTTRTTVNSFINTVTNNTQAPGESPASHQTQIQSIAHHNYRPDPTQIAPMTDPSPLSSTILEESIRKLEHQIQTLQSYDEEFAVLKLEDSRRMLRGQIQDLEAQLSAKRRERGLGLVERLRKEGFSTLAEQVGLEVSMSDSSYGDKVGLGIKQSSSNG